MMTNEEKMKIWKSIIEKANEIEKDQREDELSRKEFAELAGLKQDKAIQKLTHLVEQGVLFARKNKHGKLLYRPNPEYHAKT